MKLKILACIVLFLGLPTYAVFAGTLNPVTATPANSSAGASTIYTIDFTTAAAPDSIPADGRIVITFPGGFDVSGVTVASSANGSMTGGFSSISTVGTTITLIRDATGNQVSAGAAVSVNIANVTNSTTTGTSFTVTVATQTNGGTGISSGTSDPPFPIVAGALSKIVIEDAAGGGGSPITIISTDTDDDSQQFFAVGRDQYGNFVSNESVTWGVTGGIGSVSPTSGTSTTLTLTTPGTGRVTADNGSGLGDATGDITVSEGALNSLVLRDATGGLGNPVGNRTMTTSDDLTLYAAGYDGDGNYIADQNVTWSSSGLTPAVTGSGTSKTFSPNATGSGTITGDAGGGIDDVTGTITVNAGTVASITVKNQPNDGGTAVGTLSLTTDDVRTFYAAGYDADGDYIGDVTVTWAVTGTLDAVSPTSGSSTVFDPFSPGTSGTVTATHALASDATGTITVSTGSLAQIIIRDASGGGGSAVDDHTMTTDGTFTMYAAGYDADDNFISDQSATWSSGGLTPSISGTATNRTFSPTKPGSGFARATVGSVSDVATITVNVGALDHIIIRDGANGSGNEVTTRTVLTNESLTVYAAGYDADDNFISDQSVTWGKTGDLDSPSPGTGTSTTLSPSTAPTSGTITADAGGGITDATGNITVNPGPLSSLTIRDQASNTGSVVTTAALTTDDFLNLFAAGYDAESNYISDIVSDWSVTNGIGTFSPTTGANSTFDAQSPGTGVITADAGGSITDDTGNITVSAGGLASFQISTIATPPTAGQNFSFTVTAKDAQGNDVSHSGTVTLSDNTGTLTPTSVVFSNQTSVTVSNANITKAQTGVLINASGDGALGQSNSFTVNPAGLDHFVFDTISGPKTAGSSFQIVMTAKDAYENTRTAFSGTVSLTTNKGSVSPSTSGSFSSGTRTETVTINESNTDVIITATSGSSTGNSNSFNVQAGALDHFTIDAIGTQNTNTPFLLKVTAQDANNNTVTSFTGKVNITDDTGTISPTQSDNFSDGKWSGTVTITQAITGNTITVTNSSGSEQGTSGAFNVISTNIDHFAISTISSPQTAGAPFNITITAQDASGNTVTDFTGTVNLNDLTGTLSPKITTNFTGGVLSNFQVSITKATVSDVITVSGVASGTSGSFDVQAGALDHFVFDQIGTQTAGSSFQIVMTAKDAYENTRTAFSGTVSLTTNKGSISPSTSGSFSSGTRTQTVTINQSNTDVMITATSGSASGNSNLFNVEAGALDHFAIDAISTQNTNTPFLLKVTAQDANNNTVTSFTGKVDIEDDTGTISPTQSGDFSDGKWSGTVTITKAITGNTITVTNSSGVQSGTSGPFDVTSTNVDHFTISPFGSPQTAGAPFNITITAQDASGNTVTSFTGTVNLNDLTGTLSPKNTTNFTGGVLSNFQVTITEAIDSDVITVSGVASGESNPFEVKAGALDHFVFDQIGTQTAGTPFAITITAEDANNNTKKDFNSSVSLSVNKGSISPTSTNNFSSGKLTQNVTINQSNTEVIVTASSGSVSNGSNSFNVQAGALDHFTIDAIGTQNTNTPFLLKVTAKDGNNNTVTGFTGKVDIDDDTGTISPTQSDNFSDGKWSGTVTVTQAITGNTVTVTNSSGSEQGTSGAFDVISTNIDHFAISSISSPQTAGAPFNITITAQDASGNTVTSFTGTVNLNDLTGTLSPTITTNFTGGVLSNFQVSITKATVSDVITVSGVASGTSGSFDVQAGALDHFVFDQIGPQTAGTSFAITATAQDAFDNTVDSFSNMVALTVNKGTIFPPTSNNFSLGVLTQNVTINESNTDVKITATSGSISDESNLFNVGAGMLDHFAIDSLSTQSTNTPFLLKVTARDANDNTVTDFIGKVNISDATATISPTQSGDFVEGKWSGLVTLTQVTATDSITVTNTSGVESGTSNSFAVVSTTVDHFTITNITSPKTAGQPFTITIFAEDQSNNIVSNFAGKVNLSDQTNTISPTLSSEFVNGVLSSFSVTITKSWISNTIKAEAVGKAGTSNPFNVDAAILNHFQFAVIPSPQIAGTPFSITVTALDQFENIVTSFISSVTLSDQTTTIGPTSFGPFANGQHTADVTITRKINDNRITARFDTVENQSGEFNVKAGALNHLTIRDQAGGFGNEVLGQILTLDQNLRLYSAGYDAFNNYIRDVVADWDVTGDLDLPNPLKGTSTLFDPVTPGTSGTITADTSDVTVAGDATGIITVGDIAKVIIRDQPNGQGVEVGNRTITADDSLKVYAAGYDQNNNFIGAAVVEWSSTGDLEPAVNVTGTSSVTFFPTRAPRSGQIVAHHPTATDDNTGTVTVLPGAPFGPVTLTPVPSALQANGTDTSTVTSSVVLDKDGNPVGSGKLFLVTLSDGNLGTIITPDADQGTPGHQIATDINSQLVFKFQAGTAGGKVTINVFSSNASGSTSITIGSMAIESIETDPPTVSQEQSGIQVRMLVRNLSSSAITEVSATLSFKDAGNVDRTTQYGRVRTDGITQIPGGATRTLTFNISVNQNATLGEITIDGEANGKIGGVEVGAQGAAVTDSWIVQNPAVLSAASVSSPEDTVSVNQQNIQVTAVISNNFGSGTSAAVNIDSIKLNFLKDGVLDKTSDFPFQASGSNPASIPGGEQATFTFTVGVGSTAEPGDYVVDVQVFGKDANSGKITQDLDANTPFSWSVKSASTLQIVSIFSTGIEEDNTVLAGRTNPWTVSMVVKNNGNEFIDLDLDSIEVTNIKFFIGNNDVTPEYVISQPSELENSGGTVLAGGKQDTLNFTINLTGSTTGTAEIRGQIEGLNLVTLNRISDNTNDGGTGSVTIIPTGGQLLIFNTKPNTLNSTLQDVGIVNTNQEFDIEVELRNGLSEPVDNVKVKLSTNQSSIIAPDEITIPTILQGGSQKITFDVTASPTATVSDERFTVQVIEATRRSGGAADVEVNDNTAFVRVQRPAGLRVEFRQIDPNQAVGDTFTVRARVVNTGQAQVDSGQVRLFPDPDYTFVDSDSLQIFAVNQIIEWQLRAPDSATVEDEFVVQIAQTPIELNTGQAAAVDVPTDTATIKTVDTDLFIQNFSIVEPTGAVDDTLSTDQPFDIMVRLKASPNIDSVRVTLDRTSAVSYERIPGSEVESVLVSNPTVRDSVLWKLTAPNQPHASQLPIGVRVRGWDGSRQVSDLRDTVRVVAVRKAFLVLEDFRVSNPNTDPSQTAQVSLGQAFEVSALVLNTGKANLTGPAQLLLTLGNSGFAIEDSLRKNFVPGTAVKWDLRVPEGATLGAKSISVSMDRIPDDENTNNTAESQQTTRSIPIAVQSVGFVRIDSISTTSPAGASDNIVSTEQQFIIEAVVEFSRATGVQAELITPSGQGFSVIGSRIQDINESGPRATRAWTVVAPVNSVTDYLSVKVTGRDSSNVNQPLVAGPDSIRIAVVQQAQLNFNAQISAPPSATDRILTVGQIFTITANLENLGQAQLNGVDSVRITLPPGAGYTTLDPLVRPVRPGTGGEASWQITAPKVRTDIRDIRLDLRRFSRDENTDRLPGVNASTVTISVTTELLGLKTMLLTNRKKLSAVRGESDVPILGLRFENDGDLNIDVEKVTLSVEDKDGNDIAPNAVFSALSAADSSAVHSQITSMPGQNPIEVSFSPTLLVPPKQAKTIDFLVDILSQTTAKSFQLVIDSPQDDIVARDTDGNRVAIKDESDRDITAALTSGTSQLIDPGLQASFFNYPNPFGYGSRASTFINYHLEQDSDIQIKIYTLLGELVWSRAFKATDLEGKAGKHDNDVEWDGRNDQGQPVINGVYVAVITTGSSKAMTKIAVTR